MLMPAIAWRRAGWQNNSDFFKKQYQTQVCFAKTQEGWQTK